jgi:penicillin-binding protein 2
MSRALRRLVPSMFTRRLLLLAAVAVGVALLLAGKLAWLTLIEGSVRRQRAEQVLTVASYPRTARGRILDCKGRVLAEDVPSEDLAVNYAVITDEWAYTQARSKAYNANRHRWRQLTPTERQTLIGPYQPAFEDQTEQLWQTLSQLSGVPRAELKDRRATIARKVKQLADHVWMARRATEARRLGQAVPLWKVAQPIEEQKAPHALLPAVDAQLRVSVERRIAAAGAGQGPEVWKMVSFIDSKRRHYPLEACTVAVSRHNLPGELQHSDAIELEIQGVALHTIGDLRTVEGRDINGAQSNPFANRGIVVNLAGYRPGDLKGRGGIERSQEQRLRGSRGRRFVERATGNTIKALSISPVPGRDVQLSLDIQLQARIEALMSHDERIGLMRRQRWHYSGIPDEVLGEAMNGAAVVMDVASGEIRAAVTVPGVSRADVRDHYMDLLEDEARLPLWNRPVQMAYQPGSTVKPAVLVAAVTDQVLAYDETIECLGMLDPDKRHQLRCWIYKVGGGHHGPLNGPESIKHSCNVFYFNLGRRLGGLRLVTWYDRLGVGRRPGSGLLEEARGNLPALPDPTRMSGLDDEDAPALSRGNAILMAIGQGPIRWTPLQASAVYATIARQGSASHPTFVARGDSPVQADQVWRIDPRAAAMALDGLYRAANEPGGTVHHLSLIDGKPAIFDMPGVRIYAKSGTADSGRNWTDSQGTVRDRDHAWTICLVQRDGSDAPDFVVVVVVEDGGSGGAVAGPIVNQILHEMRMEGYL